MQTNWDSILKIICSLDLKRDLLSHCKNIDCRSIENSNVKDLLLLAHNQLERDLSDAAIIYYLIRLIPLYQRLQIELSDLIKFTETRLKLKPCADEDQLIIIPGSDLCLLPEAAIAFSNMQLAARKESAIVLQLVSAYRSPEYQCEVIERSTKNNNRSSNAATMGLDGNPTIVAPPGTSFHCTGTTIDILDGSIQTGLTVEFETTPAYGWLQQNGIKFGFMPNYSRNNVYGVTYEPWEWSFIKNRS